MILLVEDDPVLGPSLKQRLELEGFAATHATTLAEAHLGEALEIGGALLVMLMGLTLFAASMAG